jgi:16S rRNA (guanine527-N7)-methyltransferase
MNFEQFKKQILSDFKNVSDEFFDKIIIYKDFLQEYNKNVNLTRLDAEEKIFEEYFYDSIIPYKNITLEEKTLLDIGSGSGIPGVVLKLLVPSLSLTIIETNGKKVTFLKELVNKLGIKANIYKKRAEEIRNNERENFDIVTSRAVAELKIILEISVPYAKVGGLIIEPKSKKINEELESAKNIIDSMDITLTVTDEFESDNMKHNVLIFKKNKKTNGIFPRD